MNTASHPIVLSICTDAVEPFHIYKHGYHLGTDLDVARNVSAEFFRTLFPKVGSKIVSMALFVDDEMVDYYDGLWDSDRTDHADLEGTVAAEVDNLCDTLLEMTPVDLEYLACTFQCEANAHPILREAFTDLARIAFAAKARNASSAKHREAADAVVSRWAA